MSKPTDVRRRTLAPTRLRRVLDGDAIEILRDVPSSPGSDRPPSEGPWAGEPDLVGWIDEATRLDCIIRREPAGHLGGYVGVPERHPLHGYGHRAIAHGFEIEVHGGLTYGRACQERARDALRICHVAKSNSSHSRMWWFGFECDQVYDIVPGMKDHGAARGIAQTYRDAHYVYRQTVQLAAQLDAIARGEPKPALACPPPPLGLGFRSED